jgi:hypothetical protein
MYDKIITRTVSDNGSPLVEVPTIFFGEEVRSFSPVPRPAPIKFFKMTEIPEAYPKYDPCRKFRERDVVTPRLVNGRSYNNLHEEYMGKLLTVVRDEEKHSNIYVQCDGDEFTIDPAYLELVTPVEELKQYFVAYDDRFYHVHKKGEDAALAVYYEAKHPHAKEAAQAECDRLNAEYRKEQE